MKQSIALGMKLCYTRGQLGEASLARVVSEAVALDRPDEYFNRR